MDNASLEYFVNIEFEQGYEQGFKQGFERGVRIQQNNIALKMMLKGYDSLEIMELTGISTEQLEELHETIFRAAETM